MNESTAALSELAAQEQQSILARSPEYEDVEKFDAIIDDSISVGATHLDVADSTVIRQDQNFDVDKVPQATDRAALDPIMPHSFQLMPYIYQGVEQDTGNKIVTQFTQSLADLGDRQDTIATKVNGELFSKEAMNEMFQGVPTGMKQNFELMWSMQQTQMEVQRWTVEVNLLTTSVSKSTSGVQTLFRSSG